MKTRIDYESGAKNLFTGAAVLTHTPGSGSLWNEAVLPISLSGLNSAASTLTITVTQGGVQDGDTITLEKASGVTARKAKLTLIPDGGAIVVTVTSSHASDTAVTATAELWTDPGAASGSEIRQMIQSAAPGLIFAPTNGKTGVRDLCGRQPVPGAADYEVLTMAAAATWKRLCPAARTASYYFDAQTGNDANDGLTEATPKQTISAMNTLLSAGDVRIYAKGTWRHAASAGVTMPANTSLTRWPDKSPYRITGCRTEANAGAVTWTLGAGNRYSATIANAGHLHPKSWGPFQYLICAASTAEVEANSYSYYITGSTVHVNMGGTNPNTIDFELTHTSDYGSLASGVTVTGGGVFIEGLTADHNGYGAYAVGTNQSYGVVCNQTGESVVYIKDCAFGGHYYHNVGTLSGSGGRTIIENCVAGGCRDNIATHINFFATSGGNEGVAYRCRVVTDRMPRVGMLAYNEQEAFFGHTAGGNVSFMSVIACELTADGQDPAESLGRFNDVPTPTKGDPSSFRCCFHRCRTRPGIGSRTVPWISNSAYVACDIAIRPAQSTALCISSLSGKGLCIATEYDIDFSGITPGTNDVYGIHANAVAADVEPEIIASTVRFRNTLSGKWYGFTRFNSTTLSMDFPGTSGTTSRIVNSAIISDSPRTGSVCRLLLGDVLSPSGVFRNNALYGWALGGAGDEGYSSWIDTVVLQSPAQMGSFDPRLAGLGSVAFGAMAEVDRFGRPLATPGQSIGPYGVTAGDYDADWRFSLTPAQLAKLETASLALPATGYTAPQTAEEIINEIVANDSFETLFENAANVQDAVELGIQAKLPDGASLIAAAGATAENLDQVTGGGAGGGSGAYSPNHPGPDRIRRAKVYNTSAGTYLDPIRVGEEESCWFGVNFEGTSSGPLARVVSATVLGYADGDTPPSWDLVPNGDDAGTIDVEGARTASVQFTGHAAEHKARVRIVALGVNGKRYEETVTVEVH